MGTRRANLLAVGEFGSIETTQLRQAAAAAAFDFHAEPTTARALQAADDIRPSVMVVASDAEDPAVNVLDLRASHLCAQMPIIGLASMPGDLDFASMFGSGGDDLVGSDRMWPLVARLRALPREAPPPASGEPLRALVADADRVRRLIYGHALRSTGHDVAFAAELGDLANLAKATSPDLIVMSSELTPNAREVITSLRKQGSGSTWIISTPPLQLKAQRGQLTGLDRVRATDAFAPAENVAFLANELRHSGVVENRASRRLLYGTTVRFRVAGRDEDDCGFSFNVSEGGLYVRTLALPDEDEVWLELSPPRVQRRVRLVGQVAWRRRFCPNERATVPPGFGVRIVDGSAADLALWEEGYRTLEGVLG